MNVALLVKDTTPGSQERSSDATGMTLFFGESGLLENEPTAPAEQAHTTRRRRYVNLKNLWSTSNR